MDRTEALRAAAEAISESEVIALACHIGPDGDALGSMMGLALAARDAGKTVVSSFGSPFLVPDNLAFLPTDTLIAPSEFPKAPELMIVLDAGSSDRLGELGSNASKAETLIVVDHHMTNEGFGDIAAVDGNAAATAELVMELLDILGWALSSEIATCLHTAIVTDTGRFQYPATSPATLRLGARMVEAGADTDFIAQQVYEQAPFGYLKAASAALATARLDTDLGVVSVVLTADDLAEAGIDWGDIDNLINTVRLPVEADVAVLAKVHDDGRVKLSLRSRGATDVGAIASALGGGGHRLAAGATVQTSPEDAISNVTELVRLQR